MTPYLEAAERTGGWLVDAAERSGEGWLWRAHSKSAEVTPGLGWGTGGPPLFFVELYRTTGEDRWLEPAVEARRWMDAHLEEQAGAWAGCGLFTGIGGWVVFAEELAAATGEDGHRELARRCLDLIVGRATHDGGGLHWHGYTEILWGTSGIGSLLLRQGRDLLGDGAVDLATRAGDWVCGQAQPAPTTGLQWTLGPGFDAEHPDMVRHIPGFAHGAAGIGFFLARLAEVTGQQRYADAARGAAEWILTTTRTDGQTCQAFHHDLDGEDWFTYGWCYGPPGLGWFFRQLEIVDADPRWRELQRRAARTDVTSGIPARREPGFWDNVARCCGSAGVADWFLDLHSLEPDPAYLDFATVMVDDLLDRGVDDEHGTRWSNYEHRNDDPQLPAETTYMQGASGIGSTLCRLHRHLADERWTVAWPHAPTWDAAVAPVNGSVTSGR